MKRLLFVLTIVVLLAAGGGGYWWARASLPQLEGQLPLSGLNAPVEVLTDQHGVPSVYARDTDDAWFAAGAMHARDRLWQMETYRRVTLGRLSEVLGEDTLSIDQRFLTLGLRDAADAEWQRASPTVRTALERYSAGVNAVMATMQGRLRPLEFQILRFDPAPWTPVDSLAVGRLLAWRLAENHQAELVRGAIAAKFGEEVARLLGGRYPASGPTILESAVRRGGSLDPPHAAGPGGSEGGSKDPPLRTAHAARRGGSSDPPSVWPEGLKWLHPGAKRGNSNNWVVAARKTKGGRPILANDPHLQIEFPSVWYEMHLVAAGLDVIGVTIPGVPFVALGHNQRIAWGMTNTGADVQDLFIERVDVGGKRVFHRGSWTPVQVTPAGIPVRGRPQPFPFEIWKTRNGPIFADVGVDWEAPPAWLSPEGRTNEERRAYSLRWDSSGDLATAFEAINRATDWESFTAAVASFTTPSQNIVYADVDGNIGYAMSGRVPVRSSGDGTLPVDAASGAGEWSSSVGAGALPQAFNPSSGYIASSNNEIDRGLNTLITRDWAAPFRAARVQEQLAKAEGLDVEAMIALQNDRKSLAADVVLQGVADAIASAKGREADAQWVAVLDLLGRWDRIVDDRPVVSLYQAFEHAVWLRTFGDEMEEPLFEVFYEWAGGERHAGLYSILGDPQSRWFDDITTVEKRESRNEIFLLAARDAEEMLDADWGRENQRGWDRVHAAHFEHPIGNAALPLRWLFNRGPVPITGDGTTVMRVSWHRLEPFTAYEYPSWRQIFDAGQWDESRVAHPSGQSGHPLSPFYFDQNESWRAGRYRVQPFSRNAVSAAARHRLLLVPGDSR